jgi:hypothetical protein
MKNNFKIFVLVLFIFNSLSRDPFEFINSGIVLPDISIENNIFNLDESKEKLICVFLYLENDYSSEMMASIYNRAYNLFKESKKIEFYRFYALCCVSSIMITNVIPKVLIIEYDKENKTSKIFESGDFVGELSGIKTYDEVIRFIQRGIDLF